MVNRVFISSYIHELTRRALSDTPNPSQCPSKYQTRIIQTNNKFPHNYYNHEQSTHCYHVLLVLSNWLTTMTESGKTWNLCAVIQAFIELQNET